MSQRCLPRLILGSTREGLPRRPRTGCWRAARRARRPRLRPRLRLRPTRLRRMCRARLRGRDRPRRGAERRLRWSTARWRRLRRWLPQQTRRRVVATTLLALPLVQNTILRSACGSAGRAAQPPPLQPPCALPPRGKLPQQSLRCRLRLHLRSLLQQHPSPPHRNLSPHPPSRRLRIQHRRRRKSPPVQASGQRRLRQRAAPKVASAFRAAGTQRRR